MIAAHPMSCESIYRPTGRRILYIALLQIAVSLFVVLLLVPLGAGWQRLAANFAFGLAYANCIGWPCWLVMPYAGMYAARLKPLPGWLLIVGSLSGLAVAGSLLAVAVLAGTGTIPWRQYWPAFWGGFQLSVVITLVIGIGFFVIESLRYRVQYEAAQASLSSLESRLHPHFLFNTLNSIAALIPEDPAAAEQMTERLAALLRFSLDNTESRTVTLEQELKITTDYLAIENTRFAARLQYSVAVLPGLMRAQVPPFSLQTLAENSVKYGGTEIRISAANGAGRITLSVWDSGKGFTEAEIRPGHGLDNLRSRLAMLWGPRARLEISRENSGTSVRIDIPETHERESVLARLPG